MLETNVIHNLDCLKGLKMLGDKSISCCITSPPYFNLRDYGVDGQIGLEETPTKFINKLVKIFREVKRVLADDGTLWVNIGDSYASLAGGYSETGSRGKTAIISKKTQSSVVKSKRIKPLEGLKAKDLIGIPWMLAFALRKDGWYLRRDIIWAKPNPMPESVTDRCTKSHEYIFMLSKSPRYYYNADAIKTEPKYTGLKGMTESGFKDAKTFNGKHSDKQRGHSRKHAGFNERWDNMTHEEQMSLKANKRSVWQVPTKPYADAHFATYPPELILDAIKAACPENGIVLDPFMGAGTTALVCGKLNRNFIGFELNPEYVKIANKRLRKELGMFNPQQKSA
jgi:DNA modification methylase